MAIVKRFSWDTLLVVDDVKKIESELCFWQSNINAINCKRLSTCDKSSIIIYSDASKRVSSDFSEILIYRRTF